MATYVIGDIQGCYDALQALLEKIHFDPARDRLWALGDLVNRGPHSLATLRFFQQLGDSGLSVLGNHDLHLLALGCGQDKHLKPQDTLQPILQAPDREELLDWLRRQPLLYHAEELGAVLLHAGLPPQWDFAQAKRLAAELQAWLSGPDYAQFFAHYHGDTPKLWSEELSGWERLRFIAAAFTRLRYCSKKKGKMLLNKKLAPEVEQALSKKKIYPWFLHPQRRSRDLRILFGHWSTLGYYSGNGVYALDTGCLWGGRLSALRLEDYQLIQVTCQAARRPEEVS